MARSTLPAGRVSVPPSLDALVAEVAARLAARTELAERARLAAMFGPCLRNALETTVSMRPDGTAFVATGDIPAMWLRDSTAQVRPYLVLAGSGDPTMLALLEAVLARQVACVLLDPSRFTRPWFGWANALFAELVLIEVGLGDALVRPVVRDASPTVYPPPP